MAAEGAVLRRVRIYIFGVLILFLDIRCGYGWIDALRDEAEKRVSDEQMAAASDRFPHLPPATKEAYWFRTIFDELFPGKAETTVMAWVPAWSKSKDPSGRAQKVHAQTTEQ